LPWTNNTRTYLKNKLKQNQLGVWLKRLEDLPSKGKALNTMPQYHQKKKEKRKKKKKLKI
jgi:hypothetical protein